MSLLPKRTKIKTFEETRLTEEERTERRKRLEEDRASAAYYKEAFENPEAFFIMDDNSEDEISEDEPCISDDEF